MGKDEQESESNLEEEEEYQEETSLEDKDDKAKCSVCKLGDQYSNARIITLRYMSLAHSPQLHFSIIFLEEEAARRERKRNRQYVGPRG